MPRALVYGDVDMNLLDGSAVWLQSVIQALVGAGCSVTLLLKAPVRTERLLAPIRALDGVTVRSPHAERMPGTGQEANLNVAQAVAALAAIDGENPHDLVVLRGRALVVAAAKSGHFDGRLWSYLTDVPQSVPAMTPEAARDLAAVANASRYLLCQTEELRCFLEGSVAAACGKCVLFPPTLPPSEGISRGTRPPGGVSGVRCRRAGRGVVAAGCGARPVHQRSITAMSSPRRPMVASGSAPAKSGTSLFGISTVRSPAWCAPYTSSNGRSPT